MDKHNVFISWSGKRSKWVAEAIHGWLPTVIQAARPWMSDTDIDKGSRGLAEVTSKLQMMRIGIVCLTPENLTEPWILYEAGALSKAIDDNTRLCAYLLGGLRFQDVKVPLGMFQMTIADKGDTLKLIHAINKAVTNSPIPQADVEVVFNRSWADLETKIKEMPSVEGKPAPKRQTDDIVTEILETVRAEANQRQRLEDRLSNIEEILNRPPYLPINGYTTFDTTKYTESFLNNPTLQNFALKYNNFFKSESETGIDEDKRPKE